MILSVFFFLMRNEYFFSHIKRTNQQYDLFLHKIITHLLLFTFVSLMSCVVTVTQLNVSCNWCAYTEVTTKKCISIMLKLKLDSKMTWLVHHSSFQIEWLRWSKWRIFWCENLYRKCRCTCSRITEIVVILLQAIVGYYRCWRCYFCRFSSCLCYCYCCCCCYRFCFWYRCRSRCFHHSLSLCDIHQFAYNFDYSWENLIWM